MKLFLVGGFLGSGKTTAILQAAMGLQEEGKKAGIVTNDQGDTLVDTALFRMNHVAAEEVSGACFCCNFGELLDRIGKLRDANAGVDIIFAESVGSCTDLAATVVNPLLQLENPLDISLSVFADIRVLAIYLQNHKKVFHRDMNYIYQKQLEEADILVVNKTDLLSDRQLKKAKSLIEREFPGKKILYQHSLTKEGVLPWLTMLLNFPTLPDLKATLQLDYEKYASGEGLLAWLDATVDIRTSDKKAAVLGLILIKLIRTALDQLKYPIGHLKFLISDGDWYKKISYTPGQPFKKQSHKEMANTHQVTLMVNARVQTQPLLLKRVFEDAVRKLKRTTVCQITEKNLASFKPGYPRPTHRVQHINK
ncbi:hypothetical protein FW778_22695 [Ginsengibacter hankyongi]|uniref:CobW/HypB/UreG nucleotide-binding domain-containing protein n=1 Tax=Ginsengibacter hankyongi TaxID=2607284 RepID=A0A5J5IB97_9BACT|nr:GTP-binding protein [Ginsengibacter hankyongi]KAA9034378.1 hypothetical protein FW778_22695 [Ginsengibacter hankyongi]